MPLHPQGLRELDFNLQYCIRDIVEGFQRLRESPADPVARERWLEAMAKCEAASRAYLTAVSRTNRAIVAVA